MPSAKIQENLTPTELADAATSRDLGGFLTLYGDTLLLLIRLPEKDLELASGLGATAVRGNAGLPVRAPAGSMEFHTVVQSRPPEPVPMQRSEGESDLASRLEEGPSFAVPLRKRNDSDSLYVDRISVGRARNKDIVLRHRSVSKFHGWFEVDELGAFYVADAGSKNPARVNGRALAPRERTPVEPGDWIHFGSVGALLCSPRALWSVLQGGTK